jgi:hypothetical protein
MRTLLLACVLFGCAKSQDVVAKADDAREVKSDPPPPKPPPKPEPTISVAPPLPPFDDACVTDADCVVTTDDLDGPNVCCPGCKQVVASAAWVKSARAACAAHPPKSCPPVGCAMPLMGAKCNAGHCVAGPP